MRFYFVPNRLFWLVCLVVSITLLFLIVLPVGAQDTTPVVPPDVLPPGDALTQFFAFILNVIAPLGSSLLTTTLVSVIKLFTPETVSATIIRNVVAGVLTVLYWVAVRYNFQDTFASVGQFLVTIIPAALLLYGNFLGSSRIHRQAVEEKTPILSYKRS